MRRFASLPSRKTVRKNIKLFGPVFILGQLLIIGLLQFGLFSLTYANVITIDGIEKGDQSIKEQLFHQGMQAYLDSNYQQAFTDWNNAASEGHSKATFNVGRMWLLGQVPGQLENKQRARHFFQKSIDLGYAPGMKYLEQSIESLSEKERINLVSKGNLSVATKKQAESTASEFNIDNNWLENYPNKSWVIQIFASQQAVLLKQMIRDYSLKDKAQILTEKIDNTLWYKLIYGQYSTKQLALDARQSLPERLRKEKPWVREVSAMKNIEKR